jgi:putative phage-type endonuclease
VSVVEIPRPADRLDWLEVRKGYANASDAAVYLGCHPFKSLADLAVEKLSPVVEKTSRAMERGNRLEAAVADWWADEHRVAVYEPGVMYANGRILATLDRRIVGNDLEALEVKTTAKRVDAPAAYWWWQVQAQMFAADLERVHLAVLDGSMDLSSYTVDRDGDAIGSLVEQVERVWSFLDLGMVPEGVELTAEHVATLHPEPVPESVVDAEGDGVDIVRSWLEAKRLLSDAEKAEKDARNRLCALLGDAEVLRIDGRPVCSWKAQSRTSVDTKTLLADHPDLAVKYERTSSFRVLRPVKGAA